MKPKINIKKATYMVPNLFTVANMALGFYAIQKAFAGDWVAASAAVFMAHIMDILDGRVARWMGSTSEFGGEFDSFADWISFGIAPGIMVYLLVLQDLGKAGFALAFFYVFAGALRLARFNIKSFRGEHSGGINFSGLPIPVAGGFLAVCVLLIGLSMDGTQGRTMEVIFNHVPTIIKALPILVFLIALLMASQVQYSTMKGIHFFRPKSTVAFMITLLVCFMIYAYPQNTLFFLYTSYILWGLITTGWRAYRIRRKPDDQLQQA